MAKALGVTVSTVGRWARGEVPVPGPAVAAASIAMSAGPNPPPGNGAVGDAHMVEPDEHPARVRNKSNERRIMTSRILLDGFGLVVCVTRAGLSVQRKGDGRGKILPAELSDCARWIAAIEQAMDDQERARLARAVLWS